MRAYPSTRNSAAGMSRRIIGRKRRPRPGRARAGVQGKEWGGGGLDAGYVGRVQAFVAGLHFELHHLPLGERLEAVHLNRREMHEHIFATVLFNEAVALGVIEPLHLSLSHSSCLLRSHT